MGIAATAPAKEKQRRANGEGSLIKLPGCRFWYMRYYDQTGRRVQQSTKTAVRQEAQSKLTAALHDAQRGLAPMADAHKLRYKDLRQWLLDSYAAKGNKSLTTRANGEETITGLTQLDKFFGFPDTPGQRVAQITTETAEEFIKRRKEEGVGNAVINRSLACLRRMLRIAQQKNRIQRVPHIEFLAEPKPRKGFLELAKFEELIAQIPPHLKPYITFLYFCGGRKGEAAMLEWPQADLQRGVIRIEETKNDEAREIPLPERLIVMLERMQPKQGRIFDTTNLRKEWIRACAAVGLGRIIEVEGRKYDPRYVGLNLHDFRRSAARNLVTLAGVPERVAMKITGHKTRAVFDRYHIVNTADVENAMQAWESVAAKNLLSKKDGLKLGKRPPRSIRKPLMALSSRG